MRRFDRVAVGILLATAVAALLLGIGTIAYAYAVVHPKLTHVNEQFIATAAWAERGLRVLDRHDDVTEALEAPRKSAVAAARALPDVFEQSAYLSEHAAQTLARSAQTLRAVEEDAGFILPDDALDRNAEALTTTARSLEGFAPLLYTTHEAVDSLAHDLARASAGAAQLQQALRQADVTPAQAATQLRQLRTLLRTTDLPNEATRLTGVLGVLLIVLSVTLLGTAGLWYRLTALASPA